MRFLITLVVCIMFIPLTLWAQMPAQGEEQQPPSTIGTERPAPPGEMPPDETFRGGQQQNDMQKHRMMNKQFNRSGMGMGMQGTPLDFVLKALKPTKEQMEKINNIKNDMEDAIFPLGLKQQKAKIEIAELLHSQAINKTSVTSKIAELHQLGKEEHQTSLDHYFRIRDVLTPTQKKSFTRWMIQQVTQ